MDLQLRSMTLKLSIIILLTSFITCKSNESNSPILFKQVSISTTNNKAKETYALDTIRLKEKAKLAMSYAKENSLNTKYVVLIDMQIHSGRKRLFLWDFKQHKIILSGLSSHGCGTLEWGADNSKTSPKFSNIPDSHLSSLGKYKIGNRGWSNWGINVNYKLHGLEKTNNNAYKRVIVLHSWEAVKEIEPYPIGTPEGWGCPAINNAVMKKLDQFLKQEKTSVLLWIYE